MKQDVCFGFFDVVVHQPDLRISGRSAMGRVHDNHDLIKEKIDETFTTPFLASHGIRRGGSRAEQLP
jgi:hypothetical protein